MLSWYRAVLNLELIISQIAWGKTFLSPLACLMNYKFSHSGWWEHSLIPVLCVHRARFTLILSDDPSPDLWSFTHMHALITVLNTWGRSSEDLWASLCVQLSDLCTPWPSWSLGLYISNSGSWLDSTWIFLPFAVVQKCLWGNKLGQFQDSLSWFPVRQGLLSFIFIAWHPLFKMSYFINFV